MTMSASNFHGRAVPCPSSNNYLGWSKTTSPLLWYADTNILCFICLYVWTITGERWQHSLLLEEEKWNCLCRWCLRQWFDMHWIYVHMYLSCLSLCIPPNGYIVINLCISLISTFVCTVFQRVLLQQCVTFIQPFGGLYSNTEYFTKAFVEYSL